ncbi:MAG: hypothetical protein M3Q44_06250 [bacterium]|nr:hypothetical protein [bacterium]
MSEYRKHAMFIALFIVIGVSVSLLLLNKIQQKKYLDSSNRTFSLKQISFNNSTVYYPENVFQVPTQIYLGDGTNSNHLPKGIAQYKDYTLKTTHSKYLAQPDPANLNLKIEINYQAINTQQCEISEQDFTIYQYDSRNRIIKLATSIDTRNKIASAKIDTLPLVEIKTNQGTTSWERWAYFILGNKQNRFIAGGCGEDAYVYLKDNKVYNLTSGFVLPYQLDDAVYESKLKRAAGAGLSFPFSLENGPQEYDLSIDTYFTDLPLNKLENLKHGYDMSRITPRMVQTDEKVISRKVDTSKGLYILELEGLNYKVVRVARQSTLHTTSKQNIFYILEVSFAPTTDAATYSTLKEYVINKASALEFIQPKGLE